MREAGAGRYELNVDRDGGSGARFYDRPLGEFPVTDRAATYTEGVLETLRDARRLLPEVRIPRVEGVGRALWRNLPQDFRDFYWAEMHGRELSIAIYSDEPYVPWELIVPEGPDGAAAPMLGVAFSVARWKRARFFPDPLRVAGFAVVVPAYAATPLPYAEEEAGELQRDFGARRVPGEYAAVVQLLRSRGLQAIHFAGHGRFDPGAADASELLLADAPLRPTDVAGATIGQAERPLVFVNACEVGQQEWALTQIGGWAEAFCAAGCTAFVGPYWPVEDRVAARAARGLLRGPAGGGDGGPGDAGRAPAIPDRHRVPRPPHLAGLHPALPAQRHRRVRPPARPLTPPSVTPAARPTRGVRSHGGPRSRRVRAATTAAPISGPPGGPEARGPERPEAGGPEARSARPPGAAGCVGSSSR